MSKARDFAELLSSTGIFADGEVSASEVTNLHTVATSGSYNDLGNTPNLHTVATSGSYSDLGNTPNLHTVAISGSYNDLGNTPNLHTVAISGSYADLSNTPSATALLTDIKTVDGASSGLDADLLDGQEGSYYTSYTDTAVANIVDSAPGTLDTLNELAAALGDDANFSTTVTNSIATKLPLAGGTLTGALYGTTGDFSGNFTIDGSLSLNNTFTLENSSDRSGLLEINQSVGTLTGVQLRHSSTSYWSVMGNQSYFYLYDDYNSDSILRYQENSGVILYYNGSQRLNTSSSGIYVSGNITLSGTVDGRDIATDGTKLDGIETGATADQTKSDIDALGINAATLDSLDSTQFIRSDADDFVSGNLTFTGTGAIKVPSGTTAQQPSSPSNGMLRYNSDDAQFEGYADGAWGAIAGGGAAAGTEIVASSLALYKLPDTSTNDYVWKVKEAVPNNFTVGGTWQGALDNSWLYILDIPSVDTSGEYFETNETLTGHHLFYGTLFIADASTVTVTSNYIIQGIAGASSASESGDTAVDKVRSSGEIMFIGAAT